MLRWIRRTCLMVLGGCLLPSAHVAPQSCTALPHRPNEAWISAGTLRQDGAQWTELGVEASPGRRFGISFHRATGGFEGDEELEAWAGRVGVPFQAGPADFCLFGGFELNDFSFQDRYDVDRGEAEYLAREVGLRIGFPVANGGGATLSIWAAPAVTYLWLDNRGRTLVVDDELSVEERHRGGTGWEFTGEAGLSLRWKMLGLSGGITRRSVLSSDVLAFLKVGVQLIPSQSGLR